MTLRAAGDRIHVEHLGRQAGGWLLKGLDDALVTERGTPRYASQCRSWSACDCRRPMMNRDDRWPCLCLVACTSALIR